MKTLRHISLSLTVLLGMASCTEETATLPTETKSTEQDSTSTGSGIIFLLDPAEMEEDIEEVHL